MYDCVRLLQDLVHTYITILGVIFMFIKIPCVQIFAGLYFREFCESTGDRENKNTKMCTHTVQACCCSPPFAKLKSRILLGVGRLRNIRPVKICTHTVITYIIL